MRKLNALGKASQTLVSAVDLNNIINRYQNSYYIFTKTQDESFQRWLPYTIQLSSGRSDLTLATASKFLGSSHKPRGFHRISTLLQVYTLEWSEKQYQLWIERRSPWNEVATFAQE